MKRDKKQKKIFRLVLRDENTFEEVYSYRVHKGYWWLLLIGLLLVNVFLTAGVILAKPYIERWIKGDTESDQLISLRQRVIEMEAIVETQNYYLSKVQHLLAGNVDVLSLEDSTQLSAISDSVVPIERIEEDELLRNEIALDQQIRSMNLKTSSLQTETTRSINSTYLVNPVEGILSMGFDPEQEHLGVDINAPSNTPIKTIMDGHVIFAGWNLETGNTVGIQHSGNLITFYKHNSSLLCKTGDIVKAGEAIAIIGNTGTLSSGPHLHFELWLEGKAVDPMDYFNFQ